MDKLHITPEVTGFTVYNPADARGVRLDSPRTSYATDIPGRPYRVNVEWLLTRDMIEVEGAAMGTKATIQGIEFTSASGTGFAEVDDCLQFSFFDTSSTSIAFQEPFDSNCLRFTWGEPGGNPFFRNTLQTFVDTFNTARTRPEADRGDIIASVAPGFTGGEGLTETYGTPEALRLLRPAFVAQQGPSSVFSEYEYFMEFFRTKTAYGVKRFLLDLEIDGELTECIVEVDPNTLRCTQIEGNAVTVVARLRAKENM